MFKLDGRTHPCASAVKECVDTFNDTKNKRGRKAGWRKTKKAEDSKILKTFKKVRPDGHGVDARKVHSALPKKLRKKISRKTVVRRLAEKRYTPTKKASKSDPGPALARRRKDFAKMHKAKTPAQWKEFLQGIGDLKDFTYYPADLRPRFAQLRAPWTYMQPEERFKPAFLRPKRWFAKKDWKKVKKQTVFGLTTSTGKSFACLIPTPFDAVGWKAVLQNQVVPFLRRAFPSRRRFRILLDGEKRLRAEPAKSYMAQKKIELLADWPKYSPDLNPQEHVWAGAEKSLREAEKTGDTFHTFGQRCLVAVRQYKGRKKLVASMAARMKEVIDGQGNMTKR